MVPREEALGFPQRSPGRRCSWAVVFLEDGSALGFVGSPPWLPGGGEVGTGLRPWGSSRRGISFSRRLRGTLLGPRRSARFLDVLGSDIVWKMGFLMPARLRRPTMSVLHKLFSCHLLGLFGTRHLGFLILVIVL